MTDVTAQAFREAADEIGRGAYESSLQAHCSRLLLAAAEQREQLDVLITERDACRTMQDSLDKMTAENQRLSLRVEGLRRTLDNDPAGAAKRLQNLASAFSTCDLCEQPCEDEASPNILCGACLTKFREQIATLTAERDEARQHCEDLKAAYIQGLTKPTRQQLQAFGARDDANDEHR